MTPAQSTFVKLMYLKFGNNKFSFEDIKNTREEILHPFNVTHDLYTIELVLEGIIQSAGFTRSTATLTRVQVFKLNESIIAYA